MEFVATTPLATGGQMLVQALQEGREGFVCRVRLAPEQGGYAKQLAWVRRVAAKRATGQDYGKATEEPEDAEEQARLVADARAVLAETVVNDLLKAARVPHKMQPPVSFNTEHDPDLEVGGRLFDVKSAGQASPGWHHGTVKAYRATDDKLFTVRGDDARHYEGQQAQGFVGVYLYVENDQPHTADVFYVAMATVQGNGEREATLSDKRATWHGPAVPFPDGLHWYNRAGRLATLAAAGYHELPQLSNAQAAKVRGECGAQLLAGLRTLQRGITEEEHRLLATYIRALLQQGSAEYWQQQNPRAFGSQHLLEQLLEAAPF